MPYGSSPMRALLLTTVLLAAGCADTTPEPMVNDGFAHLLRPGAYVCRGEPVSIDADHIVISLTGPCTHVRIAGSHDQVHTDIAPLGVIEATGDFNVIGWRQTEPGAAPLVQSPGAHNDIQPAAG